LRVDVLALVVSVISLVFAGWTGLRGLQLADRQSSARVVAFADFTTMTPPPSWGSVIYCYGQLRMLNQGGASVVLTSVDVTVKVSGKQATATADFVALGQRGSTTNGTTLGDYLLSTYALEDRFPLTIPAYGGAEANKVTAELENPTMQFSPLDAQGAIPIDVGYRLFFSDGEQVTIPPRTCTTAKRK